MTKASRCVLIVDGSAKDRARYRNDLSQDSEHDYAFIEASTSQKGLQLWKQHSPDVILLDYWLPDGDGTEFLTRAQALSLKPCPTIFITSQAEVSTAVKALKAGAQDYLDKAQVTRETLQLTINYLIENSLGQEYLRATETLKNLLLENSPDCIKVLDQQGRIVYMNANGQALMEIDDFESCRNKSWGCFWDDERQEIAQQTLEKAKTSKQTSTFSGYCDTAKGTPRCWNVTVTPVLDDDGTVVQFVSISRDITERIESEQKLKQTNIQLESALLAGEIGTWSRIIDEDKVTADPRFAYLVGLSPEEAVNGVPLHQCLEAIHPDDRDRVGAAVEQATTTGQVFQEEYRVQGITGTRHDVSARGRVEYDQYGKTIIFTGVLFDITERKQVEQARENLLAREQNARQAAETASRVKDEFLAIVSHELRTPLGPILGWSQLLSRGKLTPEKTKQALETIVRNAKIQSQLINDLLDVSRVLRGKLSLDTQPVKLTEVIQAAMDTVQLSSEAKNIGIYTHLSEAIGPVMGDSGRLQQVMWNLLSNAVKFTPDGGRIDIEVSQQGAQAQISVRDSGKGIPADFLPYVFNRFSQEDGATTRQFGGLGLGLAIARYLVELHGGTIAVSSDGDGQGASFVVALPLTGAADVSEAQPRPPAKLETLEHTAILLVDDDEDARDIAVFVLEDAGAIVTAMASAQAALSILQQSHFDILISDIGMPDMDGYELMKEVRALPLEQCQKIPAIALTAYAGELDYRKAHAAGFQRHVAKPVEPQVLVDVIADTLSKLFR